MTSATESTAAAAPPVTPGLQPDPVWTASLEQETVAAHTPAAPAVSGDPGSYQPAPTPLPSTTAGTLTFTGLNNLSDSGIVDAEADQRARLDASSENGTSDQGYFHGDVKVVGRFNVQAGAFAEAQGPTVEANAKVDWLGVAGEGGIKAYGHGAKTGLALRYMDNGGTSPGASAPAPGFQSWVAERTDLIGADRLYLNFETGFDRKDMVAEAKINTLKGGTAEVSRHVDTHYARLSINSQHYTDAAMIDSRVDLLNVGYETKHGMAGDERSRLKVESGATIAAKSTKNVDGYQSREDVRVVYDPATGRTGELDLRAEDRADSMEAYDTASNGGNVHFQTAQTFTSQDGAGRFNVSNIVTDANGTEIVLGDDVRGAGAVTVESDTAWHGGGYYAELHNGEVQSLTETGVLGRGTYQFISPEQAYLQAKRNIDEAGIEGAGVDNMSYERWLDANRQNLVTKNVGGREVQMIEVTSHPNGDDTTGRNLETGLVAVGDTTNEAGETLQEGGIYAMYDPSAQLNREMNNNVYAQTNTYGTIFNEEATQGNYTLDGRLNVGDTVFDMGANATSVAARGAIALPSAASAAATKVTGRTIDGTDTMLSALGPILVPPAYAAPLGEVGGDGNAPDEQHNILSQPFHDLSDRSNDVTSFTTGWLDR